MEESHSSIILVARSRSSLFLDAAGERRIVASADELGLRLRDELGRELKELLGILRARIAQRVHAEEVRSIVLVQQVDARPIGDPGVNRSEVGWARASSVSSSNRLRCGVRLA